MQTIYGFLKLIQRGNEDFVGAPIHTNALSQDCRGDYFDLHQGIQEPLSSQVHSTCGLVRFCTVLNNFQLRVHLNNCKLVLTSHFALMLNDFSFRHAFDKSTCMTL